MDNPFKQVTGRDEVEQLVAQSAQHSVIIFKHDTSCPISKAAYGELQQLTQPVAMIDVALQHDLSQEIAERMSVQHASPQVLILRNGQAAWSASLYDITRDAVMEAMEQA